MCAELFGDAPLNAHQGRCSPPARQVYWKSCKPIAAFLAILMGSLTRFILEFALPKDSLLLAVGTCAPAARPQPWRRLGVWLCQLHCAARWPIEPTGLLAGLAAAPVSAGLRLECGRRSSAFALIKSSFSAAACAPALAVETWQRYPWSAIARCSPAVQPDSRRA